MKTKLYIYATSPEGFLNGDRTFSMHICDSVPGGGFSYANEYLLASVDVDISAGDADLRASAVNKLSAELASTRSLAEVECQRIESKIQSLLAIEHKPSLEVVS